MRNFFLFLSALLLLSTANAQSDDVPAKLKFAGMNLSIDGAARTYIAKVIAGLKRSPSYFQSLVDKAEIAFPFVEEAFAHVGVPEDLKFIVLQESGLRADVVSSSGAVGFWQFKEPAAREVGLIIDRQVDERMHIFRASLGAARYFFRINRDFDNWVYAIIGYNRGPFGALSFITEKYYGAKNMPITGKTHWYALKAIAYKLAFEDAMGRNHPENWLEPRSTHGEKSVAKLAQTAGLSEAEFREQNKWIRGSKLPEGQDFIYYIPRSGQPQIAQMRHFREGLLQGRQMGGPETDAPKPGSVSKHRSKTRSRRYTYLEAEKDTEYGLEYVRAIAGETLVEIAVHNRKKTKKLQAWNGLAMSHRIGTGEIIYLKPTKKRKYHVAAPGQSLSEIAGIYDLSVETLRKKNRMRGNKIMEGQKIYLKKRKPKGEKPLIVEGFGGQALSGTQPDLRVPTESGAKKKSAKKTVESRPSPTPAGTKYHTVKAGDTLWRISQKHGTSVDTLRKLNRIKGNEILVGQRLRVR